MTMITNDLGARKLGSRNLGARTKGRTRGPVGRLLAWMSLYSERQALSRLDQHLLDDIGITREQARKEARRPVWDAPDQWLR